MPLKSNDLNRIDTSTKTLGTIPSKTAMGDVNKSTGMMSPRPMSPSVADIEADITETPYASKPNLVETEAFESQQNPRKRLDSVETQTDTSKDMRKTDLSNATSGGVKYGDDFVTGKVMKKAKSINFLKQKVLVRSDGNLLADLNIVNEICDLGRGRLKDAEFEREFVKGQLVPSVRRNAILGLIGVMYNLLYIAIMGTPSEMHMFTGELVVFFVFGASGFLLAKYPDRVNKQWLKFHYHLTPIIMFFFFCSTLVYNLGYLLGSTTKTVGGARWRLRLILIRVCFYPFVAIQAVQYNGLVMAFVFLLTLSIQIMVLGFTGPVYFHQDVLPTLVTYALTALKTVLVVGMFKYRTMITQRVLFYQTKKGMDFSMIKDPPTRKPIWNWNAYFKTSDEFNGYHDKAQRIPFFNSINLTLIIDLLMSVFVLFTTDAQYRMPSIYKLIMLIVALGTFHFLWRMIERTDMAKKRLWLNILCVSMILVDHVAFFLDATLTMPLITESDALYVSSKFVSFVGVVAVNTIAMTSSSMRLPWTLFQSCLSLILVGITIPIHRALLAPDISSSGFYFSSVIPETILFTVLTIVVSALESRALIKMFVGAYENLRTYHDNMMF